MKVDVGSPFEEPSKESHLYLAAIPLSQLGPITAGSKRCIVHSPNLPGISPVVSHHWDLLHMHQAYVLQDTTLIVSLPG